MPDQQNPNSHQPKSSGWKITLLISAIIIVAAGGLIFLISTTEPSAQQESASKKTAMLVEVMNPEYGSFHPTISALGTVRPKDEVQLGTRVSGEIIELSPRFQIGETVLAGEELLKVDPTDYRNTVAQRESALLESEANLQLELGRQRVAKLDFNQLERDMGSGNESLILREPQLQVARAQVAASKASLDQAKTDLARTVVKAPFDAQILSRNVSLGSQVSPGDSFALLVGVDEYWVTTSVPMERLRHLRLGNSEETGSIAKVRDRAAWSADVYREGELKQLIGALNEESRLARITISVTDPLAKSEAKSGLPPLIIGSVLEVQIEGKELQDVHRIPRPYLREGDTVWINDANTLRIQPVSIVFRDTDYVYIDEGLETQDEVVTNSLSSVVQGAALRTEGESTSPPQE